MSEGRANRNAAIALLCAALTLLVSCAAAPGISPVSPAVVELATLTPLPSTSAPAAGSEPTATKTAAPTAPPSAPGLILYESFDESGPALWQVNGDGTDPRVVVPYDPPVHGFGMYPRWSPDEWHFSYLYHETRDGVEWDSVWIAERDGSNAFRVAEPESSAASRWSDANTLVYQYARGGTPYTYTYHLDTGMMAEGGLIPEMPGFDRLSVTCSLGCSRVAATKDGRALFIVDRRTGEARKVFEVGEQERAGSVYIYGWSSDGERLAFGHSHMPGDTYFSDLYTVGADGQDLRRLTSFEAEYEGPASPSGVGSVVWSPDGEWLAFNIAIAWQSYLGVIPAVGGPVRNLGCGPLKGVTNPVWSPDSTRLAFICNQRFENGRFEPVDDQWDIYTVDIHTGEIQRLTNDKVMEMHIAWR